MLDFAYISANGAVAMRIIFPLVPIEFEITARKRTQPFRFGVRSLMIAVAAIAIVVYLLLPLSAADQRLMSIYEQLGNSEPKANLTSAQVISQIGPPSGIGTRTPKTCTPYTWVVHFDRPASHKEFELNLQIDPDTDLVAAWGLNKKEYEGLDLISFRLAQLLGRVGL
jgi:hypothetical protein